MAGNTNRYTVAICEKEYKECELLKKMIEKIFFSMNKSVDIEIFHSGKIFTENLKEGDIFDFVILDFELNRPDSISIGKYIRDDQRNIRSQIIFISSKILNNTEIFSVQPLDFLLKPISYDALNKTIIRGIKILGNLEDFFYFQKGKELKRVTYNKIVYFYSRERKIYIITTEGEVSFYGQIKCIRQILPQFFQRIHQSYIINMNMIDECKYSEVIMSNGTHLSISRPYRKEVRTKLKKYNNSLI